MNDLTSKLTMMADEMTGTDFVELRDRVGATSRRLRRRQAALTSLACAAVAGVVVAGVASFLGDGGHRPGPIAATSPTPASTTVSPVAPSASASASSPPDSAVTRALPGALSYLTVAADQPVKVVTVSNSTDQIGAGNRTTTVFGTTTQTEPFVGALSPDRSKLAVIESPAGSQNGDLVVMEPGGIRHTLAHNVFWGGGVWPAWTPDSSGVLVQIGSTWKKVGLGGKATAVAGLSAGSQYITWSADATWWAYSDGSTKITVSHPDGTGKRQASVAGLSECQQAAACPFAVQAVSDDGRYVALGHGNTDPLHVDEAHLVFDMQTKKLVSLPQMKGDPTNVYFRPDGGSMVRSLDGSGNATLYLLDAHRAVTGSLPDPVTGDTSLLVAYRP